MSPLNWEAFGHSMHGSHFCELRPMEPMWKDVLFTGLSRCREGGQGRGSGSQHGYGQADGRTGSLVLVHDLQSCRHRGHRVSPCDELATVSLTIIWARARKATAHTSCVGSETSRARTCAKLRKTRAMIRRTRFGRTISGCRWKVARANPCTTYRRTARPIRNTPLSNYSLLLNSESHSTMLSELACPSWIQRHDLASSCHGSCPRCVVQFLVMVHCPYTESQ
ncbi:hypothetical protein K466DRAFT_633343 [Polyporus arcularius HHB13444]|uniref:Uncharacterized protein n=1 Tax=Polyporus arcularius HHB13444 TaxID=1314778 RepID=A0A5C3NYQ1_9APHY|nr:hypothetical protein K466DRAFT_633343 [Polyporus arcularius HHB13444]